MYLLFNVTFFVIISLCCSKPTHESFTNEIDKPRGCECVPFLLCENGTEIINGAGLIDIRSNAEDSNKKIQFYMKRECESYLEVCCNPPNVMSREKEKVTSETLQLVTRGCGLRNFEGVGLKILSERKNDAKFGEFPWMVAVLHSTPEVLDLFRCGGSLIHRKVILTAAHCVHGLTASELKIRAGEWDTQSTYEILPHQDRAVEAIVVHENYHPRALYNDVALLILNNPVEIVENVDIICLPESNYEFDTDSCTATGWGKDKFGKNGQHQEILKSVQLSLIPRNTCQNALRNTRLGKKFELDQSFMCAGGMQGEDTCKGDGGSPLVCPLKGDPTHFVQVGIVSWGIECGTSVPGVYTNVFHLRPWIDEQLMFHNLDNSVYQHRLDVQQVDF